VFKKVQNTGKIQVKFANPISKYFVANYSWSDAIIATKQHSFIHLENLYSAPQEDYSEALPVQPR